MQDGYHGEVNWALAGQAKQYVAAFGVQGLRGQRWELGAVGSS